VRCGKCGNENAEANRFCGMCGAPLGAKNQVAGLSPVQSPGVPAGTIAAPKPTVIPSQPLPTQPASVRPVAVQPIAQPTPPLPVEPAGLAGAPVERRPAPLASFDVKRDSDLNRDDERDQGPIISGPSFLGSNKPAPRRAGLHADGYGHSGREDLRASGNVDYLLDDEEEPKRGWGKLLVIVVALALAGGLGYLRWKQGGFDWLKAGDKKPQATQPSADAAPSGTDNNGSPAGAAAAPDGAASAAGGAATSPAAGGTAAPPAETAAPQATPSQTAPSPAAAESSQNNSPATPQATGSETKLGEANPPADSASENADSDSDKQSPEQEQPAAPKAAARKTATAKPTAAKPSPAKPVDSVAEAQRYIYGRGVRQDCDHGLKMLKSSAGQSDAKAMISLGALYSTGTCAPHDLPTAYRWFALALHKQPDNQALQDDLQKLWSQMTQPERQLAIKLSQ
jgi:hypothetical protein